MEHESCDSISDMVFASIPAGPCIQIGQQHPKLLAGLKGSTTSTYSAMLENEQSMLQNMMNNSDGSISLSGTSKSHLSLPSPNVMSMKRSLFWDEDGGPSSTNKRFLSPDHQDNEDGRTTVQDDNGSSMASFLGQFPQTPQALQQAAMLGNVGDGVFRQQPYNQLPSSMNWYS